MRAHYHVSPNRLEGSLSDVGLDRLLAACRRQQVTGTIDVAAGRRTGTLELRLGAVESVVFGLYEGDAAMEQIAGLVDGTYELAQRLPDIDGSLGAAAELHAHGNVMLVDVMQHCERHALSCTITALSEFEVGTVEYRAGDIVAVTLNGRPDEDAIVDMLRWKRARFRVAAPPLSLEIEGWPVAGRAKTEPFVLRAGATEVTAPPPPRRRRAQTEIQPKPHKSSWGDLAWNVVAFAVGKIGDRVRARTVSTPPPMEPPPSRRTRVRMAMRRVRKLFGRRFARAS